MKKTLLALSCAAFAVTGLSAEEITLNMADIYGASTLSTIENINQNGVQIAFDKATGGTAPAFNKAGDVRLYANNTMTFSFAEGATQYNYVSFAISSQGCKRLTSIAVSTGQILKQGTNPLVWNGEQAPVTFTVGEKAVYGTEGDSKAGQFDFTSITFSTEPLESGELVVPQTEPEPDPEPTPGGDIFSADFSNTEGDNAFTEEIIEMADELTYIWKNDTNYKCAKASSYVSGTAYLAKAWYVSPVIDLAGYTNVKLTADIVYNYFSSVDAAKEETAIAVREQGTTEWSKLSFEAYPEALGWKPWVNIGNLSIDAFAGKKIEIGLYYECTTQKSGTVEVANLKVTGDAASSLIEAVASDNAPVEYFNLQGQRVTNPSAGQLLIRRQGGSVQKIAF